MLNLQGDHPFTLRRNFSILELVLVLILHFFWGTVQYPSVYLDVCLKGVYGRQRQVSVFILNNSLHDVCLIFLSVFLILQAITAGKYFFISVVWFFCFCFF